MLGIGADSLSDRRWTQVGRWIVNKRYEAKLKGVVNDEAVLSAGSRLQSPHLAQGGRRLPARVVQKALVVVTIRQGLPGTKISMRVLGRLLPQFQCRSFAENCAEPRIHHRSS